MKPMMRGRCDQCEKEDLDLWVAAGPGPISTARCKECWQSGTDPFWLLVAYLYTLDWNDIEPGYQQHVVKSCERAGKTLDDFKSECAQALKQLDQDCFKEDEDGKEG